MDFSNLNGVRDPRVEKALKDNADMLHSTKSFFTFKVESIPSVFALPFLPIILTIVSCLSFEKWYEKILASLAINIIVLPIAIVVGAFQLVSGIVSIPLALMFEGIPYLFSKKYRNEFKLCRAVKKLALIYNKMNSENSFRDYFNEYTKYNTQINALLSEIDTLNTKLGRNNIIAEYEVKPFTEFDKTTAKSDAKYEYSDDYTVTRKNRNDKKETNNNRTDNNNNDNNLNL